MSQAPRRTDRVTVTYGKTKKRLTSKPDRIRKEFYVAKDLEHFADDVGNNLDTDTLEIANKENNAPHNSAFEYIKHNIFTPAQPPITKLSRGSEYIKSRNVSKGSIVAQEDKPENYINQDDDDDDNYLYEPPRKVQKTTNTSSRQVSKAHIQNPKLENRVQVVITKNATKVEKQSKPGRELTKPIHKAKKASIDLGDPLSHIIHEDFSSPLASSTPRKDYTKKLVATKKRKSVIFDNHKENATLYKRRRPPLNTVQEHSSDEVDDSEPERSLLVEDGSHTHDSSLNVNTDNMSSYSDDTKILGRQSTHAKSAKKLSSGIGSDVAMEDLEVGRHLENPLQDNQGAIYELVEDSEAPSLKKLGPYKRRNRRNVAPQTSTTLLQLEEKDHNQKAPQSILKRGTSDIVAKEDNVKKTNPTKINSKRLKVLQDPKPLPTMESTKRTLAEKGSKSFNLKEPKSLVIEKPMERDGHMSRLLVSDNKENVVEQRFIGKNGLKPTLSTIHEHASKSPKRRRTGLSIRKVNERVDPRIYKEIEIDELQALML